MSEQLSPPALIASRLASRVNAGPPVDVEALASSLADVDYQRLPTDADAITLHLKQPDVRPEIVVNSAVRGVRRRFTLAHEIGHICIPWHVGSIVSHTGGDFAYVDHIYRTLEQEANEFAGELLVPTIWLREAFENVGTLSDLLRRTLNSCSVSMPGACIRLAAFMRRDSCS